jgi:hypothetical protein
LTTRKHVKELIKYNEDHSESTKQAVLNVLRHVGGRISPHHIKLFLDTKSKNETLEEYEKGNITISPAKLRRLLKDKSINIRTIHRKLAELVKEGSVENNHGRYSLTMDAKSDVRYFAAEFGRKALNSLMGAYFPISNTIQQNLLRLKDIIGSYILFCFIQTARPVRESKNNRQAPMTNNQKNSLVYSCLKNIIPIKDLYDYFLTVVECSNNATIDNSLVHPLQQEIIKEYQRVDELERTRRKSPSALELYVERLSLRLKSIKESTDEDYEHGRSWTELEERKVGVLEEVSDKTFPLIYKTLNKEMQDFKENPKQKIMSQRESWPEL